MHISNRELGELRTIGLKYYKDANSIFRFMNVLEKMGLCVSPVLNRIHNADRWMHSQDVKEYQILVHDRG